MTPVSYHEAAEITAGYVCAACWGQLSAHPADQGVIIECAECGADTPGFVSRNYTERRKSESLNQYYLAREALREALPWMRSKKTQAELLSELGF